jgi:adenylate cyclase
MRTLLLLALLLPYLAVAQLQGRARLDSLLNVVQFTTDDPLRVDQLNRISFNYRLYDPDSGLMFAQQAFELANAKGLLTGVFWSYNNFGANHNQKGEYRKAIEYFEKALNVDHPIREEKEAMIIGNIALALNYMEDHAGALRYSRDVLEIHEKNRDRPGLASTYNVMGNIYNAIKEHDRANEVYEEALAIYRDLHDLNGEGIVLGNIGIVHAAMGRSQEALEYDLAALMIFEKLGQKRDVALNLLNIGDVYSRIEDPFNVHDHLWRSLQLSREIGDRNLAALAMKNLGENYLKAASQANLTHGHAPFDVPAKARLLKARDLLEESIPTLLEMGRKEAAKHAQFSLAEVYEKLGDTRKALEHHRIGSVMRDSLNHEELRKEIIRHDHKKQAMADSLRHAAEKEFRDLEIREHQANLNKQRIALFGSLGGLALIILLALAIYKGKKRSDDLLLNILPYETAQELKSKGHSEARQIDHVTVLFTDFKGFTELADGLSPQELVEEINSCFSAFDNIMEKHGVEKIKTIGDAYMAAGGMPVPKATHALDTVKAALDIQRFMLQRAEINKLQSKPFFEVRIGIHTGPVVAGIVGIKKFQYDIWGDTVNVASRMENHSEPGRINISETTYELVKDRFTFSHRGEIEVKGKGRLAMYFVEGVQREEVPGELARLEV